MRSGSKRCVLQGGDGQIIKLGGKWRLWGEGGVCATAEQFTLIVFLTDVLRDRNRATVPLLFGIAEDERGGSAPRRKANGCLPQGSARGGGKSVQERDGLVKFE